MQTQAHCRCRTIAGSIHECTPLKLDELYFFGVFPPFGVLGSFLLVVLAGVEALAFVDDFGVLGALSSGALLDLAVEGVLLDDFPGVDGASVPRDGDAADFLGDAKRSDFVDPRGGVEDRPPEPKKDVSTYGGMKEARPRNLYHRGWATTCKFMYCAAVKSELTASASKVGCDGESFVSTQLPNTDPTTAPASTNPAR